MKVLVMTTVYPNEKQPNLGIFIQERIIRVAELCQIKVLAPIPYFPLAGLFKKKYRYRIPNVEYQQGIEVYHPRFFVIPGIMKFLDGFLLYLSVVRAANQIQKYFDFDLIDSHFAYPDGFAAVLLGKHFKKPVTITLRGTLNRLINYKLRKKEIRFALRNANKVFSVSEYLVRLARSLRIDVRKFVVIPNGVDAAQFQPLDKFKCREKLDIPPQKKVIITVSALTERKGQQRVIQVLPDLIKIHPDILYLVVGGSSVEGDMSALLEKQVKSLGLDGYVCLTGEVPHTMVSQYLCASDVFVLATRYEGRANVLLEAMACGLPVITTNVCGNPEVVQNGKTGLLFPFGDNEALIDALDEALKITWDKKAIMNYGRSRSWDKVAQEVYRQFSLVLDCYTHHERLTLND